MEAKIYSLLILCGGLLFSGHINAQCGQRYVDSLFQYSITTVTYDVYDSAMDIYQPIGDTSSKRPVIVLAHEGIFITGNKFDDPTVVRLCQHLSERGYVVASINYRLLTAAQLIEDEVSGDTAGIITEVIQSLSDGKAAVRYFSMDAATNNVYKIDTTKMFIGGNSAGAVMALHYGYIDSIQQTTAFLQGIINANGGLEGNSGNAGYNSKVAGVISCAGGLNDPNWIVPGDIPSFNTQGTADDVVPYYCGDAEGGEITVRLCGLGSLQPIYTSAGINESSLLFAGQGHVPWDTSASMYYSVDSAIKAFLVTNFVTPEPYCGLAAGVTDITTSVNINLFPNPATNVVNLHASIPVTNLSIYDDMGRQIMFIENLNNSNYQINTSGLSKGVYFVRMETGNTMVPVIRQLVLE